ncbi:unnamed protein product [Rotaria sordida]|uniref:Uncharacterized protein n=1 Tax=Rotaria sordida TaxID=392033 RepID=A0A814ZAX1_9BILA|nr:unnamed protein product [Rotaria sordida]CAF1522780.1 unnamed protein product [Rotaria sordida]
MIYLTTFFLVPRTVYSKADAHRDQILFEYILDEFQTLLKSTMDLDDQFSDDTNEWLLIDHRLQSIKENFQFLFPRKNRKHREIKTNLIQAEDIKHAIKLHRFIPIRDDLEILHQRLININYRLKSLLSGDQLRIINDLKLMFDRLNLIKRIVKIYFERLEK